MKSSLITIASVATLAKAVKIVPHSHHMSEISYEGTYERPTRPEIRLAAKDKLVILRSY